MQLLVKLAFTAVTLTVFAGYLCAQEAQTKNGDRDVIEELRELERRSNDRQSPEFLEASKTGTAELKESGILDRALNVGAQMPEFALKDASERTVTSGQLLEQGHIVLVFYRGAWCPFCNLYLRGLERRLDEFKAGGANLVAVSVEPPDRSLAVAKSNKLTYTVLSDPAMEVARKFGIVYELPKVINEAVLGLGLDIAKYNGSDKAELPLAATYVISKKGKIAYAFLELDYKKRAGPDELIRVLAELNGERRSDAR